MGGQPEGITLELSGVLTAPPARVFELLTLTEELAKWWGPAGFSSPAIDLDLRVGGSYRIAMQPPEGEPFHLRGEFTEVDVPQRLSYTFVWEDPDDLHRGGWSDGFEKLRALTR